MKDGGVTANKSGPLQRISLIRSGSTRSLLRTPLADGYAVIAFVILLGSIVLQRPEGLVLAAPFLIAVVLGFALFRYSEPSVELHLDSASVLEGDEFTIRVVITSEEALPRLDVELRLGDGLAIVSASESELDAEPGARRARMLTGMTAPGVATVSFRVRAEQWGVAEVELLQVRVTDQLGLFRSWWDFRGREPIRIALPDRRLRKPLHADRFRRIVGSHLSTDRGDGLEIADIRPMQPGDSLRNVNWRISNRRQEPWVTLRHPDRSATVIIVVDADDNRGRATLRQSTSGALALASTHLQLQDRVGLLVVGRRQEWIPPRLGRDQMYRIANALVDVGVATGASMRQYRSSALHSIPSNAIVVVLSPLTDPMVVGMIAEVRSQGIPVSVLQPLIEAPVDSDARTLRGWFVKRFDDEQDRFAAEAKRLALIEHRIGVQQLRGRHVSIVPWPEDVPAQTAIEALRHLNRSTRRGVSA